MYDHNQACKNLDIRIQIFTIGGKLVKTLEHSYYATGFKGEDIFWDGRDDFGDQIGKGVYVYKIEIRNEQGQKGEQYEKLVILR
jgi:flagellar hook assembly protein FlgD